MGSNSSYLVFNIDLCQDVFLPCILFPLSGKTFTAMLQQSAMSETISVDPV